MTSKSIFLVPREFRGSTLFTNSPATGSVAVNSAVVHSLPQARSSGKRVTVREAIIELPSIIVPENHTLPFSEKYVAGYLLSERKGEEG